MESLQINLSDSTRRTQATKTTLFDPALIEADYRTWLTTLFPQTYLTPEWGKPSTAEHDLGSVHPTARGGFQQNGENPQNMGGLASYHAEFWDWLWGVKETGPGPDGKSCFCAIWGRGLAKSTNVEAGVIALATHSKRRYGWYISGRQAQADDHLSTVSLRIATPEVGQYYPKLAVARTEIVGERSRQLGWRRRRIWTADGFVIDALGLDSASRGAKLGDQRPDFMIFDDVDGELDSEESIERNIAALTRRILPAAAIGCIFVVAQNLVHPSGIVTRLVDGKATYLGSRTVSGPHPAIEGLEYEGTGTEAIITAGRPTWSVMDIAACQQKIKDAGIDSFLAESQNEVGYLGEARFSREAIALHEAEARDPLPLKALPEWAQDLIRSETHHSADAPYLSIWSLPIAGVAYVFYFDGAEGVGSDFHVTIIGRADTRQVVAMVRDNKREQGEHAKEVAECIRQYNNAYVGWERSHEADFASVMAAEGITRIYRHSDEPTTAQRINGTKPTERTGYPARQHERRVLVARVAKYIDSFEGMIPSKVLLSELRTFIKTKSQMDGEAGPGAHDDTVFGFGGMLLMCEQPGAQGRRVKLSSGSYSYARPR